MSFSMKKKLAVMVVTALVVGSSGAASVKSSEVERANAAKARDAEATRASRAKELAEFNARPAEWRMVGGKAVRVPWRFALTNTAWWSLSGKVIQVLPNGLLVDGYWLRLGQSRGDGLFVLKNWPDQAADGSHVSTMAAEIGTTSYTSVLGATKTVRVFDRGVDCAPPPPTAAEQAAAEVARERRAIAAAEAERAAAAEKIRVAAAILKFHQVRASEGSEESKKWLLDHGEKVP